MEYEHDTVLGTGDKAVPVFVVDGGRELPSYAAWHQQ